MAREAVASTTAAMRAHQPGVRLRGLGLFVTALAAPLVKWLVARCDRRQQMPAASQN